MQRWPRNTLKDDVRYMVHGRLCYLPRKVPRMNIVQLFILSKNAEDFDTEKRLLAAKVHPKIKRICTEKYGVHYEVVDLRNLTNSGQSVASNMQNVNIKKSTYGIIFVVTMSHNFSNPRHQSKSSTQQRRVRLEQQRTCAVRTSPKKIHQDTSRTRQDIRTKPDGASPNMKSTNDNFAEIGRISTTVKVRAAESFPGLRNAEICSSRNLLLEPAVHSSAVMQKRGVPSGAEDAVEEAKISKVTSHPDRTVSRKMLEHSGTSRTTFSKSIEVNRRNYKEDNIIFQCRRFKKINGSDATNVPLATLISLAIKHHPEQICTVTEIHKFLLDNYHWQHPNHLKSVIHETLHQSKLFHEVGRPYRQQWRIHPRLKPLCNTRIELNVKLRKTRRQMLDLAIAQAISAAVQEVLPGAFQQSEAFAGTEQSLVSDSCECHSFESRDFSTRTERSILSANTSAAKSNIWGFEHAVLPVSRQGNLEHCRHKAETSTRLSDDRPRTLLMRPTRSKINTTLNLPKVGKLASANETPQIRKPPRNHF